MDLYIIFYMEVSVWKENTKSMWKNWVAYWGHLEKNLVFENWKSSHLTFSFKILNFCPNVLDVQCNFHQNKIYMFLVFYIQIEPFMLNIVDKSTRILYLCIFWSFKCFILNWNIRMVEDQSIIEKSQIYYDKNPRDIKHDLTEFEEQILHT